MNISIIFPLSDVFLRADIGVSWSQASSERVKNDIYQHIKNIKANISTYFYICISIHKLRSTKSLMAKSYELFFLFHTKGHMMTISISMDYLCWKCSIFMNSLQPLHLGYCQHKETLNISAGRYLHHHQPHYLNININNISTSPSSLSSSWPSSLSWNSLLSIRYYVVYEHWTTP